MAYIHKAEKNEKFKEKNINMLDDLPGFCVDYLKYYERSLSPLTINAYFQRFSKFFSYLKENNSYFGKKEIINFSVDDIVQLDVQDITDYASYVYNHSGSSKKMSNAETTVDNYLSALSSLWEYFLVMRWTKYNPVASVKRSKYKEKEIIKLDKKEKQDFLDGLYSDKGFKDENQIKWNERTKIRDIAICVVLLGTGIRVAELVGMDVDDLDFQENCFKVLRKRDKFDVVYFSDSVKSALIDYLDERVPRYQPTDDENALFLCGRGDYKGKRLTERSVERIVKKYATASLPLKGDLITPHKLRATFATDFLDATGDQAATQEQLGHSDPKTTTRYGRTSERRKKMYRNILDT